MAAWTAVARQAGNLTRLSSPAPLATSLIHRRGLASGGGKFHPFISHLLNWSSFSCFMLWLPRKQKNGKAIDLLNFTIFRYLGGVYTHTKKKKNPSGL